MCRGIAGKVLMPSKIEDYAMVGDLQTAALVGADGSVDWLCFPRFDSPACFASLLGEEANGRWRIAPASGGRGTAPDLVRVVEGVEGRVEISSELVIRFDYGHVQPWIAVEGREVHAVAGP